MNEWTSKEIEFLTENYGSKSTLEIARHLKMDVKRVENKAYRIGLRKPKRFSYLDLKALPEYADVEEMWRSLEEYQDKCRSLSTHQEAVTVDMSDTEDPIIVAFLADLHIGAFSGKYRELHDRVELLSKTPNCYVVSCGDTVDNYLPTFHTQGQFSEICPPEVQKVMVEYIFERLNDRVLALVQGCHDEASHYADDFDWTKYLCSKLGCANLGFGGTVTLKLGKESYVVHARHKYRFNSAFNLTHTVKRLREQVGDFDIGCVAHNHQASVEEVPMPDGKTRVFVRPGSFKAPDRYARSLGYVDTGAQVPSVILFPSERKMLPFLSLDDAVLVLEKFVGGSKR